MRFSDGKPDSKGLTLREATALGYPLEGGVFAPEGEADLRSLLFGSENSFTETAGLAAASLFHEDFGMEEALELAQRAFPEAPPCTLVGQDILGVDLATGPTGHAGDYANRLIAAILENDASLSSRIPVAALRGADIVSLASALGALKRPLIALCPEEGLAGIDESLLARSGGNLVLVGVRGGVAAARSLERAIPGSDRTDRTLLPLGRGTPARFAGRSLLLIALFMVARRGIAGELYVAAPREDPEAVAAALWAWSWGVPYSGLIIPEWELPEDDPGPSPDDPCQELLTRFAATHPVSSLLHPVPLGKGDLFDALADASGWCDHADELSIAAFASALRALEGGLAGHARILVPRFSRSVDRRGDGGMAGETRAVPASAAPDLLIEADPVQLARKATALVRDLVG